MRILLIEDNPAEILLTKEGLKEIGFSGNLDVLKDGEIALTYLKRLGKDIKSGKLDLKPDIILLDLNLPKVSGMELLRFIKGNPDLQQIPTLILSTSSKTSDIESSYSNQANSYLVKPMEFDKFIELLQSVISYWSKESRYMAVA
ncbi:MAG: response regulator [Bacteroidia bacterium]|nr:response regulator [Bacteroidia bacterium]